MPGVFISYRREDSAGYTGRLFDILSAEFGRKNTYMDLDTIEGGDNFASVIKQKISVSDVLVAVIGDRWATIKDVDGKRRLEKPDDFVRIEIAEALQRGIRVIPVLVGGAAMPHADDLPQDLRALCERQAVEVRDAHFHQDSRQLTDVLHSALHGIGFRPRKLEWRRFAPVPVAALVIMASGVLWFQHRQPPSGLDSKASKDPIGASGSAIPAVQAAGIQTDGSKDPAKTAADVAGKWSATVKYDWGDTYKELFDFEVDGQEVTGTAGFLGDREGKGRTILEGKLVGNRISFLTKTLTTLGSETYEDKHNYKGIVEGDSIRFTLVTDSRASEHSPVHFIATREKKK